jgi:hypothetical protein
MSKDWSPYKKLVVSKKWSILYLPEENDRPVYWLRYGKDPTMCDFNNPELDLFYAHLDKHMEEPDGKT